MAMTLPSMQHSTKAASATHTYTVNNLFDRVKEIIEEKYKHPTTPSIPVVYPNFSDKLDVHKADILIKLKANLDEVVSKAQLNGYDLLNHHTLMNLSEASILRILNLDESSMSLSDADFNTAIDALNGYLKQITNQIPDEVIKVKDAMIKTLNDELVKYALDANSIPANSQLALKIEAIKVKILHDYGTFIGTAFDPHQPAFFEKTSFDVNSKVMAEMAEKDFTDALAPAVKAKMEAELQALSYRPSLSIRDLREDIYNMKVNGVTLDAHDIDTKYIGGFETFVAKYTSGAKITISEIGVDSRVRSGMDAILSVYINVSIGSTSFKVTANEHTESLGTYVIEDVRHRTQTLLNGGFSNPSPFSDEASWTEGQVLTKDDILNNYIPHADAPDFIKFFEYAEDMETKHHIQFKFTYVNNSIKIEFIDPSISSTDFEYGDKTPLNNDEKLKFWFNRHNSVPNTPEYQHVSDVLFTPSHVFNVVRSIEFVGKMQELIHRLTEATKEDKQPNPLSVSELQNTDGSFKAIDKDTLLKAFPTIQEDFFDDLDAATGYQASFKVNSIGTDTRSSAEIEATITSPKGHTRTYKFQISTVDENKVVHDTLEALRKYENTWEDDTKSNEPKHFYEGLPDTGFADGTKPPMDQLESIYEGITNLFIQIHKNPLLTLQGSSSDTKDSSTTMTMLESWNEALIKELGGLTNDLRVQLSLALGAAQVMGKSTQSKYLYVNIDVNTPTPSSHKLVAVHYMSEEQRYIQNLISETMVNLIGDKYLHDLLIKYKVPEETRKEILDLYKIKSQPIIEKIAKVYKADEPNALVADFEIRRANGYFNEIKEIVDQIRKDHMLHPDQLNKIKTASKVFKYTLTSVGGIIGLSALLALMIPIRIALGDRKFRKENPKVKRSSKKLIAISAISGLLAAASSTAIMIYVFITQGGL